MAKSSYDYTKGVNVRAIDNLGLSLHREGKEWVVRNREGQRVIATGGHQDRAEAARGRSPGDRKTGSETTTCWGPSR